MNFMEEKKNDRASRCKKQDPVLCQCFFINIKLVIMADITGKDLTILQACNGMITSDNKPVMCGAQKSIVFIYLQQCSQAV